VITTPCPPPPPAVILALSRLRALRNDDPAAVAALSPADDLARPWEPSTCTPRLREQIWSWCDAVAAWINHDYAWRPDHLIPACWPAHPHIAHELPVLACLRVDADAALDADALEAWHRDALPHFLDRLAARLGAAGCRTGTHTGWPAAARDGAYHGEAAVTDRQRRIHVDALSDANNNRSVRRP
jgi:hypothetical protein